LTALAVNDFGSMTDRSPVAVADTAITVRTTPQIIPVTGNHTGSVSDPGRHDAHPGGVDHGQAADRPGRI
jgi:hypothetical protein